MIDMVLSAVVAFIVVKVIEKLRKEDDVVSTLALVMPPFFIALILNMFVGAFGFPRWMAMLWIPSAFVVPLLLLRFYLDYGWGKSTLVESLVLVCR